ncbi:CvpA family protein [Myxococcota bacterium]|nr:CvpA family protein [Myxococcota bacterium]
MTGVDLLALGVLCLALLRGLFIGLVREAFSLGGIAAACIMTRLFAAPLGEWITEVGRGSLPPSAGPWIAGGILVIASLVVVALVGRGLRKGLKAVGLGWADRMGGALLGTAEGMVAVAVALFLATSLLGRDHLALRDSHSLALLEQVEVLARKQDWKSIDVAAPPPL